MKQNKSIKEILQKQSELVDECKGDSPLWNELSVKISRSIQSVEALKQQLSIDNKEVHLRMQDALLPKTAEVL